MEGFRPAKIRGKVPVVDLLGEYGPEVHVQGGLDDEIVFGEDFNLIQRAHRLGARFAVFRKPTLYVSARRFEKEGLLLSGYKSLKALLYQLFVGPIKKPIFEYRMGGENFKE